MRVPCFHAVIIPLCVSLSAMVPRTGAWPPCSVPLEAS